jgi:ATP-binding protein involved in chromosome partitioning
MSEITNDQVLEALGEVQDPDLHKGLVELNMIRDVSVCGDMVKFRVVLTTPACPLKEKIENDCRDALSRNLPALTSVNIKMDAEVTAPFGRSSDFAPGVKNFIAVGSGKGGVGKSTCSMNIAVGLARAGAKVGLLDTDVYGPSVPLLAGVTREEYLEHAAEAQANQQTEKPGLSIPPVERHGIKLMSIGFLVDPDKAVIWRGPMVHSAVQQFLRDTEWGELDYLVIDMPPGTGDVQLTLSQSIPLTGAVIVCTPQDVALADARKAYGMFQTTKTPVLGMIENMSYFELPDGQREYIFGEGGAEREAEALGLPFLGAIPLETSVRVGGDQGTPMMASEDDGSKAHQAFQTVVDNLASVIAKHNHASKPRRQLKIVKT